MTNDLSFKSVLKLYIWISHAGQFSVSHTHLHEIHIYPHTHNSFTPHTYAHRCIHTCTHLNKQAHTYKHKNSPPTYACIPTSCTCARTHTHTTNDQATHSPLQSRRWLVYSVHSVTSLSRQTRQTHCTPCRMSLLVASWKGRTGNAHCDPTAHTGDPHSSSGGRFVDLAVLQPHLHPASDHHEGIPSDDTVCLDPHCCALLSSCKSSLLFRCTPPLNVPGCWRG